MNEHTIPWNAGSEKEGKEGLCTKMGHEKVTIDGPKNNEMTFEQLPLGAWFWFESGTLGKKMGFPAAIIFTPNGVLSHYPNAQDVCIFIDPKRVSVNVSIDFP